MRIPTLLLVLLLAQIGWKGDQKLPRPPQITEAMVDSLAREYYEAKFTCYPALATLKGIPGYDGKLSTYSQRSTFGLLGRIRNLARVLATVDEDSLSMAKWSEYKALLADMSAQRYLLEDLEVWSSRPTLYVDACAEGVASLLLKGNGVVGIDLNPRLSLVPSVVKHARRNLTKPSEFHCRIAAERLEGLIAMLETLPHGGASPWVDPEVLEAATTALEGFGGFLDTLSLSATADFALTYDQYLILSDARNMISDMPEDMREYARGVLTEVNEELKRYPEDVAAGAGVTVSREELNAQRDSAWEFLRQADLVSLPRGPWGSGHGVMFKEMPDVATPFFGDMLYFELWTGEPGYLTPFRVSPEVREPGATVGGLISSEVYPGRHMQDVFATMSGSPVREMLTDIFTTNGWALYSQELMAREGYGGERAIRDALERKRFYAAGAIAAIDIFLGESSVESAAVFMVRETGVSESYAMWLAVQYALEPELPISYIIGERQIRQIRDEVSGILGDKFSLKAFHDDFLASGRLPLYLVRNNVVSESVGRR